MRDEPVTGKGQLGPRDGSAARVCYHLHRYCAFLLDTTEPNDDKKTFIKPLELDPDFRETKTMVLDAVRVLFDRSVVKFFPPELGVEINTSKWLTINGSKESMSERWASSQWLVAFWEAPSCLTPQQRMA